MAENLEGSEFQPEIGPETDSQEELRELRIEQYEQGLPPEKMARLEELQKSLNKHQELSELEHQEFQRLF